MAFKNKNIFTERPFFTHFASLPFIQPYYRTCIKDIQQQIRTVIHSHPKYQQQQTLKQHHHNLCHITMIKLVLRHNHQRQKMVQIIKQNQPLIRSSLEELTVIVQGINYFTRLNKNEKCQELTVIYAKIDNKSQQILNKLIDKMMRIMLKEELVTSNELKEMNIIYDHHSNLYKPENLHISLFRARNLFQDELFLEKFKELHMNFKKLELKCHFFDISTMGKEYDQTQFYLPLHRLHLTQKEKEVENPSQ